MRLIRDNLKPLKMSYPVRADIILLLRRLSYVLHVVAKAHSVNFRFESSLDKKEFYFHEGILISDLTHLFCRIIVDTPQEEMVALIVLPREWPHADGVRIQIRQTGACSFKPKYS